MNTDNITLQDYETAQRVMAHESATTGVVAHAIITLLVSTGLVIINITLAPEFPWSAFAVAGLLIGILAHLWFGYVKLDEQLTRQQRETEMRAAEL